MEKIPAMSATAVKASAKTRSKPNGRVLVVDDEHAICWAIERSLTEKGYQVDVAASAEEGLAKAAKEPPQIIFLDVRLPGEDGLSALSKFKSLESTTPVIIMTAFGDLKTAVAAVGQGASDYLTKPFDLRDVTEACTKNIGHYTGHRRESENSTEHQQTLVGKSAAMQVVFRQIAFFAFSDMSVLITGETGTGKEVVASAIVANSSRHEQPYLAVAPVAMNPELIESELFGHARGAFTGAEVERAGLFETAQGGTVLLDEIGELPLSLQAKLLRVLEQGEYSRVGESVTRKCDVRVLAATNCDLESAVAVGAFREDLFHRLNGLQIHLPPLRERPEDILLLCEHFLAPHGMRASELMSDELIGELAKRPWPGNVRELKNAVCQAAVWAGKRRFQLADFPESSAARSSTSVAEAVVTWARDYMNTHPDTTDLLAAFQNAVEPGLFEFAIKHAAGNRANAAEILGIHRGTLRARLKAHDS